MALIEYLDKVALENDPEVAAVNKVTDDDMNEIKNVVNENFTNEITIGDTEPTSKSCKIWIDTGEVQNLGSEVHIGTEVDSKVGLNILYSKNLFNENTYTNGMAWNNATGFPSRATAYFNITAGKTYSISASNISKLTGSPQIYIAEKTSIENANHTGNTLNITSNGNYTFTTTSSGKVLAVQLQMASGNISSTDYPNIMIVEGNTAQPYQPYITPTINVYGEDIYVKGQNEVYSTQEQRIGTWLGKPLYRKVFEIPQTSINSSDVTVINFNLADTNYVTKIEGMIGVTTSNTYYPIFGSPNRANVGYQVRRISSAIQIIVDQTMSAESSIKGGQMIVEYTKTTD